MDINSGISLGHFSSAWFVTNASHVLRDGQIVYLKDDSGQFKKGDGVRTIDALPWLGGGSSTISLSNTKILVGNASNEAAEVSLTLSPTAGSFALSNAGVLTMPDSDASTRGLLSPAKFAQFNSKEPPINAGTNLQYYRGDKTFQTLDTSVVPENTNLYFTNSRVESVVNPLLSLKAPLASPTFTGVTTFQNIIRLTSASLGTAVAGNVEFLTDKFYGVITTGTSRKEFVLADTALTSGRIVFTTTNGRAIDSGNLTYNGTFVNINTTAPINTTVGLHINTSTAGRHISLSSSTSTAYQYMSFDENTSDRVATFIRYNSGAFSGQNYPGTSIAYAGSFSVSNGSTSQYPVIIGGTPVYLLTGQTGTNIGMVLGTTGIRIDTQNALHNALSSGVSFHINTGKLRYSSRQVGNAGLSSGDVYVDTAANILANGDYVVGMKV